MNNIPYILCSSEKNLLDIHLALEKVGLTVVSKTMSYKEEIWMLSCPWKKDDDIILQSQQTLIR